MRQIVMGALALLLVGASGAEAQCRRTWWGRDCDNDDRRDRRRHQSSWMAEPVQFGVRGGYDFEDEVGTAGTQLRIPLVRQLLLVPSADVFFDDGTSEWQLNGDVVIRPDALGGLYGGAGVAFLNGTFFDDDSFDEDEETRVGYNLILGLESGRIADTSVRPFVEGRWTTVDDYDAFRLALGINVPVSGFRR